MSQKLPVGDFKWQYGVTIEDIRNYDKEDDIGYFVEIDCHTPEHIQDFVDDLPLFPSGLLITEDMASSFTQMNREMVYGKGYKCKQRKLAPNHFPKTSYKCHILAAQLYMRLGKLSIALIS